MFITFEGQEGAGKSTQIKLAHDYLLSLDFDVIATRDPGGTTIAEKIRHILKDNNNAAISKETEALLYVAARAQLVAEVIRPQLNKGGIVLCDRFTDSTIAYQGFGNSLDVDRLTTINNFATDNLVPDITFLLEIDPAVGLARKSAYKKLDRIEAKALPYHNLVKDGYKYLAEKNPGRIVTIDAAIGVDDIHDVIKDHLRRVLDLA